MKAKLSIINALVLAACVTYLDVELSGWFCLAYFCIGLMYAHYTQRANNYPTDFGAKVLFAIIWGPLTIFIFLYCWARKNRNKDFYQMVHVTLELLVAN